MLNDETISEKMKSDFEELPEILIKKPKTDISLKKLNVKQEYKSHEYSTLTVDRKLLPKRKCVKSDKIEFIRLDDYCLSADEDWSQSSVEKNSKTNAQDNKKKELIKYCETKAPSLFKVKYQRKIKREKPDKEHETKEYNREILCDHCGKTFKYYVFRDHLKIIQNGSLDCSFCDNKFLSRSNLARHVNKIHSEKSVICPVCGKSFLTSFIMSRHYKVVHLWESNPKTEKNFACEACRKVYKEKTSLMHHIKSVHTGERPAKCKYCDAAFVRTSTLNEHLRRHVGDARYKCPVCNKGFNKRIRMRTHVIKDHPFYKFDG